MSTYVLIHGGCHGAWCWYKVVAQLTRLGHRAISVDLPGRGADTTPIEEITVQSYVDVVTEVIDTQPENVVLVGHSLGGVTITRVTELRPEKIEAVVYVAAMLLPDGVSIPEVLQDDPGFSSLAISEDGAAMLPPDPKAIAEDLFHDCSEQDIDFAASMVTPEPLQPLMTKMETSEIGFGSVKRFYIECLRDRVLPNEIQKKMIAAVPCDEVFALDSGHSPFFSCAEQLADILVDVGSPRAS